MNHRYDRNHHNSAIATASATTAMNSTQNKNHDHRIVLLFDLDCFYAQCERVRLGLDVQVSLALLQWDSVLAVTYPAREQYGIKRGDSWDNVRKKSNGQCWDIHLHIISIQQQQQQQQLDNNKDKDHQDDHHDNNHNENKEQEHDNDTNDVDDGDVANAYDKIYKLSKEEQNHYQQTERGKRRFYYEGKACLERYRCASQRIFQVVLDSLTKRLGSKNSNHPSFILERASIDEFYLDITDYCWNNNNNNHEEETNSIVDNNHKTVVVGSCRNGATTTSSTTAVAAEDNILLPFERACRVAHWIRKDVYNTLGFTMSAGISVNKMMAKLAASYGKPNGQAMVPPASFDTVMDQTKLRKVRNFGGKLGKRVQELLALSTNKSNNDDHEWTMGDIRRNLSIPLLQHGLESSGGLAKFVYDASRGIDEEPVKQTMGALVKSITAFKSFTPIPVIKPSSASLSTTTTTTSKTNIIISPELKDWIVLLANEIVSRVRIDTTRNQRYPKSCTLNYTFYIPGSSIRKNGTFRRNRQSKSLRLQYPSEHSSKKVEPLVQQALEKFLHIASSSSSVLQVRGVGLSASNFELRGGQPAPEGVPSIDTFFKKQTQTQKQQSVVSPDFPKKTKSLEAVPSSTCRGHTNDNSGVNNYNDNVTKIMHTKQSSTITTTSLSFLLSNNMKHHFFRKREDATVLDENNKNNDNHDTTTNNNTKTITTTEQVVVTPHTANKEIEAAIVKTITTREPQEQQQQSRPAAMHSEQKSTSLAPPTTTETPNNDKKRQLGEVDKNNYYGFDPLLLSSSSSSIPPSLSYDHQRLEKKKEHNHKKQNPYSRKEETVSLCNNHDNNSNTNDNDNKNHQNKNKLVDDNNPSILHGRATNTSVRSGSATTTTCSPLSCLDSDMEVAKKLQAAYDREHSILSSSSSMIRQGRRRCNNTNKVQRIDTFFTMATSKPKKKR